MAETIKETLYINGTAVTSTNTKKVYNPARSKESVGEIALGSEEDVNYAVEAADLAWEQWRKTSAADRAKVLEQVANYIHENSNELAQMLVLEHGKTVQESLGDLLGAANVLRYYSTLVDEVDKEEVVENKQGKMVLTHQSMGVVSIIVPWNYPIILGYLMLAPALLAGNTVVIKPATYCPLTLTKILKHMASLLPKGVLNIISGSGSTVGEAMIKHPTVRKVSFTGSTEVGVSVIKNSASTIKNLSLELGGNDAAIVLKDKDIDDHLIEEMLKGVFTACGQICYNIKRIYVQKGNYQTFVDRFIAAANLIKVGNGLNPNTTMGPLNNKPQFDSVTTLLNEIKETDAMVNIVGEFIEETAFDDGYYVMPTVVTNVKQEDPIVQKEQFGPIIPIIPFDTEEEAIQMANDTEFGLGNSVWTNDVEHGFEVARKLQSGSVFVNIHRAGASGPNMPFGGFKQSGIGRGHGVEALKEQMELQAVIQRTDM
ncbi:aldehyde dehydrogenase family protein [Terrihalobacillus insolitus]|uniref:aldehyde dehydrogenase family protein n=1 Tax=Terrihalobacillus insolitus TaxID=2950438 RepID=UPI00234278A6|nr:aldehyde dehydrogenase family protein [Terrihalobacillus insolitus]MDC3411905.1 aldehyde dehydrogenase family protein [Terrihalobacillus insolitus]